MLFLFSHLEFFNYNLWVKNAFGDLREESLPSQMMDYIKKIRNWHTYCNIKRDKM